MKYKTTRKAIVSNSANLVSAGYISVMRLPPEGDPNFPRGVRLYQITSAGQEELYQAASKKREKTNDRIFQVFLSFLSFGIGLLAEHYVGIIRFLKSLFQ